jgi:hypothetical protein
MPLARIAGRVLFFVHIPKTGGTSVEAYLGAKGAVALAGHRRHGWSRTTPQHIQREIYADCIPPAFYDHGFAILRDPMERLFSEFRMRAEPLRPKLRPIGLIRLAEYRRRGSRAFGVRIHHRIEYLDFDDWVVRVFKEYRKDPYYKDNHLRPQSDFVDPGHRTFLFRKGLDPVFRWIDAVTGSKPVCGTFHERRSVPLEFGCRPRTEEMIRDFYRRDYALIAEQEARDG